jgi:Icc-related predicted phosphoesterase
LDAHAGVVNYICDVVNEEVGQLGEVEYQTRTSAVVDENEHIVRTETAQEGSENQAQKCYCFNGNEDRIDTSPVVYEESEAETHIAAFDGNEDSIDTSSNENEGSEAETHAAAFNGNEDLQLKMKKLKLKHILLLFLMTTKIYHVLKLRKMEISTTYLTLTKLKQSNYQMMYL